MTTSLIPLCIVNFFVLVKIANLVTLRSNKQHGFLVVVGFFLYLGLSIKNQLTKNFFNLEKEKK